MADAVARAAGLPAAQLRRALMLRGDLAAVAAVALRDGRDGLAAITLQVGRPLAPMLAGTAADVGAALARTGPAAIDWKLDGARLQVHRDGDDVALFTRTLDDVTARLPEVVAAARALPAHALVLDGEAIALRARRAARAVPGHRGALRHARRAGDAARLALLRRAAPRRRRPPRRAARAARRGARGGACRRSSRPAPARRATARPPRRCSTPRSPPGHEGVVVKALDAPYAAGRRGAGWLKVKPVHTLDLVVLAAEWGHGRRRGRLSNLHLGARDGADGWAMLGKTFKGLTDELLAWQTERLLALQTHREGTRSTCAPSWSSISPSTASSPRALPLRPALRFARVKRYREDKTAAEADTVATVRAIRDA